MTSHEQIVHLMTRLTPAEEKKLIYYGLRQLFTDQPLVDETDMHAALAKMDRRY
jgi:hypothetical protein